MPPLSRALLVGILLTACTTTHELGRIEDPHTRAEVDAVAASGHALVRLRPSEGARPPPFGYRVSGVTPSGLVIEPSRGQSVFVAPPQIASLSRYNHLRGARDGAVAGGLTGFAMGLVVGAFVTYSTNQGCSDGCSPRPDPLQVGLAGGAVFGLAGAALGAALGAAGGHEDRYVVAPP